MKPPFRAGEDEFETFVIDQERTEKIDDSSAPDQDGRGREIGDIAENGDGRFSGRPAL
jgi:hypothetical protein